MDNGYVHVPVGCPCEGTPHEGHEVFLLPKLTYFGGANADHVLRTFVISHKDPEQEGFELTPDLQAELGVLLGQSYLRNQVIGWDIPIPFDHKVLLNDWSLSQPVAEKADELYAEAVLAPLVKAVAGSSPIGRTAASTSRKRRTSTKPRTP